jgi:hypothetical protein
MTEEEVPFPIEDFQLDRGIKTASRSIEANREEVYCTK